MNPPPPPHLPPPPAPAAPPFSASFTLPPQRLNHNPNSNPFFFPSTATTSTDLPAALSTLTSLLHLANSTLTSLPTPLPTPTPTLIPCPFNPNHRLPTSSLFSHSLHCPSSPSPLLPSHSLSSLHYPQTLHQPPTPTPTPTSPRSYTLENHFPFLSNFFYSDWPAVVTHPNKYPSPSLLTLPELLLIECADFVESNWNNNANGVGIGCSIRLDSIRLLPSEIWAIRNEVEEWRDYPSSYSYRVFRTILVLGKTCLVDFPTWVVVNSVRYGVVIDCAMRDHIVLLVRLCLKAIINEAATLAESLYGVEVKEEDKRVGDSGRSFSCPVLGKVLMWLASQLALLYGEVNGKFFAISMLKQCVLDVSLGTSMFAESTIDEEKGEDCSDNGRESRVNGPIGKSSIFISQVAAAVAALHERSMLEEKIRASRDSQPLTAYQRVVEHETISRIADDERKRRPEYRPLLEHDGLFRQHSHKEDTDKLKTREEILAEERDYKRRRMSYRGKKSKRSTTEVMRDIIEDFMEEIKQASGFACSAEASKVSEALASETSARHDRSTDAHMATCNMQPMESKDVYLEGNKLHRRDTRSSHGDLVSGMSIRRPKRDEDDARSVDQRQSRHNGGDHSRSPDRKQRRSRYGYSRSPDKGRSRNDRKDYSRSPDRRWRRLDREDYSISPHEGQSSRHAVGRSNHEKKYEEHSRKFSQSSEINYSGSNKRHGHQREETGHDLELKNKRHGKSRWHNRSSEFQDRYNSIAHDVFEDRYNPSESHDPYEE